ncbi:MlaD family protein [Tsukamurella sp. 8F]|uniref:MlaD family protein n=1 Tax=unclassified Tsukamurella TaxID=2633480 RepID=UPI0023B8A05E|nr:MULTISPECIES: MlaD family protein [unclassified Tsukamurella]MDF0530304.1 MlaD family protein [Tsukamurella sp. 8J]MDF0587601.1 MlaD family protein [Tsukamurella sp. 8F]
MRKFLGSRGAMSALVVIVCVALAVGFFSVKTALQKMNSYCAIFPDAVGLFDGNEVAQFGYKVGQVTKITPEGKGVRVDFKVDADRKLPTKIGAVTVADSLVAQRRVELIKDDQGPDWNGKGCITNTKTPLSITDSLNAVSKLASDLTNAGQGEEFKQAMESFGSINKASAGVGPEVQEITNKLGELMKNPGPGMGDIAAILDSFAPLSGGLVQNWGELAPFMSSYYQNITNVAAPILIQGNAALKGFPGLVNMLGSIMGKYGDLAIPLLDVTVPATDLLAAGVRQFGDLLNMLPPLIKAFTVNVDQRTMATHITYKPPAALINSNNPQATCDAVNRLVPGQCKVTNGKVDVNLITTVLRATGAN